MIRRGLWGVALAMGIVGCAAGDTTGAGASGTTGSGGTTGATTGSGGLCVPGKQDACACPGGKQGVQACLADGSGYGPCECGGGTGAGGGTTGVGGGGTGGSLACGDGFCAGGEDCHSCDADCGLCAPCTIAPSCANAQIPPASLSHVAEFDIPAMIELPAAAILERLHKQIVDAGPGVRAIAAALAPTRVDEKPFITELRKAFAAHPKATAAVKRQLTRAGLAEPSAYAVLYPDVLPAPRVDALNGEFPGGTPECGAPLLRIRAAKVIVHEEDDDFANDIVYCSITSETMAGSEIRVTPMTTNLDEGDEFVFGIESGILWGQQGPRTPGGNMLLTYDCFESDTNDGYKNLVDSIAAGAEKVGGVAGDNGWIFTTVGAVAPILGSAVALDGDDHLFNTTQIIPLDKQLDLTNGRFWSVRRAGTHFNSDWDWELRIEAWGCAQYGTL